MKLLTLCLLAFPLVAHVGSPDIFYEGEAGPYRLLVTIRPPQVIPGVAEVEIRSASADVREIRIAPLPIAGPAAKLPPVPDLAKPSREDPQFFTGALWLMARGSWQVRVAVDGARGGGTLSVPVPAVSTRVLGMQTALAAILIPLVLLLCIGLVSIIGAAIGQAQVEPGIQPDPKRVRRARVAMAFSVILVVGVLWLGDQWWNSEAGIYQRYIFRPLQLQASVENSSRLVLRLHDPGWLDRQADDLLPDHGHLMHLYCLRIPEMDLVWHLHPERTAPATFQQALPDMPPGRYALYGDIVHANGMPETATTEIDLPSIAGQPLTGDDAAGAGPPISKADYNRNVAPLSGGYRMVWERGSSPLRVRRPYEFRFRIEDPSGRAAEGMELYMGMQGHAAFLQQDRSVFAHVHPSGSVPMAALTLAANSNPHAGHFMMQSGVPARVSFPYGFPKPGAYRIVVQIKRAGRVETGVFDAQVEN